MTDIKQEELIFKDNNSNNGAVLGTLEGPCADFIDSTRNGRHYTDKLWENVFADGTIASELIQNGGIPGEMDHPIDREETDSSRIAILMRDKPQKKKDGKLWAKFEILNTPLGQIAYTLAKAGFNLGISSRGTGDTYMGRDGEEYVDESTYDFKAFDLVLIPAVKDARLKLVTEGLQDKFDYKKALLESMQSASDSDRKIMSETLDNLGIQLKEDSEQVDILQAVVDHFGVLDEVDIYSGPTYILPNGKLLDLKGHKHHSDVEKWLIDSGLSNNEYIATGGSQTLSELGCIRCDFLKYYIALCDTQPTREQYNTLLVWLDDLQRTTRMVEVITPDDQHVVYKFDDLISDYIVDRIRRYYSSGTLYEKLNQKHQKDFRYKRMSLGEGLSDPEEISDSQSKEAVDINAEIENEEADNDGEALVEELQNALSQVQELQEKVGNLQEKLSVCYAKEYDYEDEIERHKKTISKLTESQKSIDPLRKRVSTLTEELDKKNTLVSDSQKTIEESKQKVKNLSNKFASLKEELNQKDQLIESLNKQLEEKENKLSSSSSSLKNKIDSLQEQLINTKKEYSIKAKGYSDKLEKANKLVEQYKKIAKTSVDKYIESQAIKLGITSKDIKSRLNESYSFKDIDDVCDEIQESKFGMSNLPFKVGFNKNSKIRITESVDKNRFPVNEDDRVDDDLLELAGIK